MGICQGNAYKVSKSSGFDDKSHNDQIEKPRHLGSILGLSSIDEQIFSCSDDKSVVVSSWDYASHSKNVNESRDLTILRGHSRAVNCVTSFRDLSGSYKCWTASRDLSVKCWDVNSSVCVRTIENAHSLNISAIDTNHDSLSVFSGSRDYTVKEWDAETGKCKSNFSTPRNIVTSLKFDQNSQSLLFQGSEDLCVRVWDTRNSSKQPSVHITAFVYFPVCLSLHPHGGYLATGCKGFDSVGSVVKIWDMRSPLSPTQELTGHTHDVTAVKYSSCTKYLVSASKDGSIIVWTENHQKSNKSAHDEKSFYHEAASVSGTGKYFTDLCLFGVKSNEAGLLNIVASAHDGSLSFYCLKDRSRSRSRAEKVKEEFEDILELEFMYSTAACVEEDKEL